MTSERNIEWMTFDENFFNSEITSDIDSMAKLGERSLNHLPVLIVAEAIADYPVMRQVLPLNNYLRELLVVPGRVDEESFTNEMKIFFL